MMMVYAPSHNKDANWTNPFSAFGDDMLDRRSSSMTSKSKGTNFIQVTGELEFANTHGYLSAESYPLLRFYTIMALVYLVIDAFWTFLCVKHYQNMILLHHFMSMILVT